MADQKEETQDLTVSNDGSLQQGDSAESESTQQNGPEVNDIAAPPADEKVDVTVKTTEPEQPPAETEAAEQQPAPDIIEVKAAPDEQQDTEPASPPPATESTETAPPAEESAAASPSDSKSETPELEMNDSLKEKMGETAEQMSAPVAAAAATESKESKDAPVKKPKNHEHRNNKKFIIITTIIIALLLAGAAVFVYLSAEENTAETPANNEAQVQQAPTEPATPQDVDQTLQEIDEALEALDDTADFSESALSDDSLGL